MIQPLYCFYYWLHCKSPMLKMQPITLFGLTVIQCRVVWYTSVGRRLRKPGEGDMGDIGQPSKMFTLSMCTTVNRKTWGQPYTRVRWVSKFNFLKWYMGLRFWIQHISEIKWQCLMSCAPRAANQKKAGHMQWNMQRGQTFVASDQCAHNLKYLTCSYWSLHSVSFSVMPCISASILCALCAISFVQ